MLLLQGGGGGREIHEGEGYRVFMAFGNRKVRQLGHHHRRWLSLDLMPGKQPSEPSMESSVAVKGKLCGHRMAHH